MPPHMGNLKKLRTLTNFSLGKESGSGIEELGKLQHIRGDLSIENLQNANPKHVGEANLRAKEHLKTLEFQWSGKSKDSERLSNCYNCSTLPPLGQLTSLKELSIIGFTKLMFVGSEFYGSCGPAMKPFRSLEILRFERMKQWEEWKDGDGAFPQLEELYVKECPKLTKAFPSHLPCLKKLQVVGCKKQLVVSLRVPHAIPEVMLMDNSMKWS
ncbi:hypothetical protein GH714_017209 [Hevea brasiliensis]|uniref:R13L1/DRL21-like LRR repeat region domain-containing protein n=1 Tax=Hevea brasiliensis TaxID=3981 RepID=A0A6A6NB07_HEVBR|nr:hypothetical protein GH714_017209 [Hevea brasiliensis]